MTLIYEAQFQIHSKEVGGFVVSVLHKGKQASQEFDGLIDANVVLSGMMRQAAKGREADARKLANVSEDRARRLLACITEGAGL